MWKGLFVYLFSYVCTSRLKCICAFIILFVCRTRTCVLCWCRKKTRSQSSSRNRSQARKSTRALVFAFFAFFVKVFCFLFCFLYLPSVYCCSLGLASRNTPTCGRSREQRKILILKRPPSFSASWEELLFRHEYYYCCAVLVCGTSDRRLPVVLHFAEACLLQCCAVVYTAIDTCIVYTL